MVHFKINSQTVETLDPVRFGAVVRYLDRLGPESGDYAQLRALAAGDEIDWQVLLGELDGLARRGVPDDIAQMLGNITNDVLRTLRGQGALGPAE